MRTCYIKDMLLRRNQFVILKAARGICHLNVNTCCFGAFAEMTDAVVFCLHSQQKIEGIELYQMYCLVNLVNAMCSFGATMVLNWIYIVKFKSSTYYIET